MDSVEPISLDPATPSDRTLLDNLLELYIHDLSAIFPHVELGPEGRFGYHRLPLYWTEPERRCPFLIRSAGRVAGFVLVERTSRAGSDPDEHDVAEFFVLQRYRRSGVGRRAAFLLWNRLPGQWTVRVIEENHPALAFWSAAIAAFANGAASESTVVRGARRWRIFAFRTPHHTVPHGL
jgi:predicted acetyltransferase